MSYFFSYSNKLKAKSFRKHALTHSNNRADSSNSKTQNKISTISSSMESRRFNRERLNLESHQLVCYDTYNQHATARSFTLTELRQIVDYTKFFDNSKSCKHYLEETQHIVSFLICSGNASEQLIPEIHELSNVHFIYIYSQHNEYDQQWMNKYMKVRLKLIFTITREHCHCRSNKFTLIINLYFRQSRATSRSI